MADDVSIRDADDNVVPIAADEIGGRKFQRMKPTFGADGEATDVSVGNPFPVRPSGALDAPLPVRLSNGTDAIDSTSRELHIREVQLRTALGTTGDAAVAAGAAGSLNAKARLMTTLLDAIRTAVEALDNAVSGSEFQVDVVASLPAGTNNIGQVDPRGNVAHDGVDAGNPIKTGGRARTSLPSAVAQDDRTDAIHDKFGRRLVTVGPLDQRRSGIANLVNTTAADVIGSQGAGLAIVVTRVMVVNASASVGTKVSVRDGTTTKATGYATPNGGGWTLSDPNGLWVGTGATAVTAICGTTAADVDVFATGYLIPV